MLTILSVQAFPDFFHGVVHSIPPIIEQNGWRLISFFFLRRNLYFTYNFLEGDYNFWLCKSSNYKATTVKTPIFGDIFGSARKKNTYRHISQNEVATEKSTRIRKDTLNKFPCFAKLWPNWKVTYTFTVRKIYFHQSSAVIYVKKEKKKERKRDRVIHLGWERERESMEEGKNGVWKWMRNSLLQVTIYWQMKHTRKIRDHKSKIAKIVEKIDWLIGTKQNKTYIACTS